MFFGGIVFLVTLAPAEEFRIAVVEDGESWFFEDLASRVEIEIGKLESRDLKFTWVRKAAFSANWQADRIDEAFEAAFNDPEVDAILALGLMSLSYLSRTGTELPKPVVGGLLQEPRLLGEGVLSGGLTQKFNLSLVVSTNTIEADLEAFHRIVPYQQLGVVIDGETFNSIQEDAREMASATAERFGNTVTFILATDDPDDVLRQVEASGVDSLYLFPPFRLNREADRARLLRRAHELGLPTFAYFGERAVRGGVLAGLLPDISQPLSRRLAGNLSAIAQGRSPNELPATLQLEQSQIYLNLDTARAIGLSIPFNVAFDAITIGAVEEVNAGANLSLQEAVDQALAANFDYLIEEFATEESRAQRFRARSALLPQLRASGLYSQIDEERAQNSGGLLTETQTRAGVVAEQVLYSPEAWGSYSAADLLYAASLKVLEGASRDVVGKVAQAYLNLLKTRALERIARENLELTQQNLKLARLGVRIGSNENRDVLRLEAAEAADRVSLFNAAEAVGLAQLNLNREMNVPLETAREPVNLGLESPEFSTATMEIRPLVTDAGKLAGLQSFLIQYALENSPEIDVAEARLESARKLHTTSRRRGWAPTVAAQLTWDHILDETRLGLSPNDRVGENEWTFGVTLSLPLFEGGNRFYEMRERMAVLRQAELALEQTRQRVESRARSALVGLSRTSANLNFTHVAAERARENLVIVTDRYETGATNLVTLLDAQNEAFTQSQNEVLAIYDFLEDLILLGQSLNYYDFRAPAAQKAAFLSSLKAATR